MDMRPPTDYEINNYDHVIFTSDVTWDPSILDNEMDLCIRNNNLISIVEIKASAHACQIMGRMAPSALLRKYLRKITMAVNS